MKKEIKKVFDSLEQFSTDYEIEVFEKFIQIKIDEAVEKRNKEIIDFAERENFMLGDGTMRKVVFFRDLINFIKK